VVQIVFYLSILRDNNQGEYENLETIIKLITGPVREFCALSNDWS
jgi:hypothetical protein